MTENIQNWSYVELELIVISSFSIGVVVGLAITEAIKRTIILMEEEKENE